MLSTWPTDAIQVKISTLVAQHNHAAAFKVARAHVPCEHTVRVCIHGSHRQDLDLPTHRQRTRDDLRASIRVQFTQVPDRDERAVGADAVDDKTCAARAEIPLAGEAVTQDHVRFIVIERSAAHVCDGEERP